MRILEKIENKKRTLGVAMAVLVLVIVLIVSNNRYKIDPAAPDLKVRKLPSLVVSASKIRIPFFLPIEAIRDALEHEIPRILEGTETWEGRIGLEISISVDWRVRRGDIRISGGEDRIRAETTLNAEAEARGVRIANVRGNLRATLHPMLNSNWRLEPNLTTEVHLSRAELLRVISVRTLVTRALNRELGDIRSRFERDVSNDDFIKEAARQQWYKICRSFPLGSDSGIWLEVKPVAVRSVQPAVDAQNIHLQFGLDAETRVVETQTQPQCPFPEELIIEDFQTGYFQIELPTELEYDTLEAFLKEKFADKTVGEDVSATIDAVSIHPDGEAIVLGVALTMKKGGWFGPWAQGTVYLSAEPRLNVDTQEIILTKFQLDIESRNALVAIFGEVSESVLLLALGDEVVFDFSPKLEEARGQAEQAMNAISTDELLVEAQLSEVRLTSLDVGPDKLRLVATAQGQIVASTQTVSWGQE